MKALTDEPRKTMQEPEGRYLGEKRGSGLRRIIFFLCVLFVLTSENFWQAARDHFSSTFVQHEVSPKGVRNATILEYSLIGVVQDSSSAPSVAREVAPPPTLYPTQPHREDTFKPTSKTTFAPTLLTTSSTTVLPSTETAISMPTGEASPIPVSDIMNDYMKVFEDICDVFVEPLLPNTTFGTSNRTRIICMTWQAIGGPHHFSYKIFHDQEWELLASLLKDAGDFIFVTVHGDLTPIGSDSRYYLGGRPIKQDGEVKTPQNNTAHANPFLQLSNLKHWFVPNAVVDHPKIHALPIGLNGRTFKKKRRKGFFSESQHIIQKLPPMHRLQQLFINFGISGRKKLHHRERKFIKDNIILWESFATVRWPDSIQSYDEYYDILRNSTFIFSPPGVGWDCYRTWEALLAGTIPIVLRTNTTFDDLFTHLPVLLVDSYEQVTQSFLNDAYETLRKRSFKYDVLKISYWEDKITSLRDQLDNNK